MVDSPRPLTWLGIGLLILAIWLPRTLQLGQYVTDDEQKWLARAANFYWALVHSDFAATVQREHPGVTVMWAGAAGFRWRYPAYAQDAPGLVDWGDNAMDKIVRAHGQTPLAMLAAGRTVLVLLITVTLAVALLYAIELLGLGIALLGVGLVAFDPFHVALSRLLHLDGLVSSLMLLAVLAFVHFLQRRRLLALVVSAVATGLACLTKTPAFFLVPLLGLVALLEQRVWGQWRAWRTQWLPLLWPLLGWAVLASLVYVAAWPAMWVQPWQTLRYVFGESVSYATGGHLSKIYFAGRVLSGDPGWWFYPVVYAWRTTPVIWIGLVLGGVWLSAPQRDGTQNAVAAEQCRQRRFVLLILLLFAVSYLLLISVGIKKLDRYLLPVFAPLDLVAAAGWWGAVTWLGQLPGVRKVALALPLLCLVPLGWHADLSLQTYPYFLSYFNPWLGGAAKAPQVMMIGRGEGLDLAAAYLNAQPQADQLKTLVTSTDNIVYSSRGPLVTTSFTARAALSAEEKMLRWLALDYAVLYVDDWQRQVAPPALLDFFAPLSPEQRIFMHGLEYARIYNLRQAPVPLFLAVNAPGYVTWGNVIKLAAYVWPTQAVKPGEPFNAVFYLQNVGPIGQNLNEQIRIVRTDGQEVLRQDGWPWGAPTSSWQRYAVWPDGHRLTMPADAPAGDYQVELSFYDPTTLTPLAAVDLRTGQAVRTPVFIAALKVVKE